MLLVRSLLQKWKPFTWTFFTQSRFIQRLFYPTSISPPRNWRAILPAHTFLKNHCSSSFLNWIKAIKFTLMRQWTKLKLHALLRACWCLMKMQSTQTDEQMGSIYSLLFHIYGLMTCNIIVMLSIPHNYTCGNAFKILLCSFGVPYTFFFLFVKNVDRNK